MGFTTFEKFWSVAIHVLVDVHTLPPEPVRATSSCPGSFCFLCPFDMTQLVRFILNLSAGHRDSLPWETAVSLGGAVGAHWVTSFQAFSLNKARKRICWRENKSLVHADISNSNLRLHNFYFFDFYICILFSLLVKIWVPSNSNIITCFILLCVIVAE